MTKSLKKIPYSFQPDRERTYYERRIPAHIHCQHKDAISGGWVEGEDSPQRFAGFCGAEYRGAKDVGGHYSDTQRFRISDKNLQGKLNNEADITK